MNYNPDEFSYGVELEYSDCYRFCDLPNGATWNDKDNTIVNSNGIANDPKGIVYWYGGEINTKPTKTIQEQIQHIDQVNKSLDKYSVNYRSNLHIHIRVPDLHKDLDTCKSLLRYIDRYQQEAFDIVETIPEPKSLDIEVRKWEQKRYQRRKKSHQYKLPKKRVEAMLASKTVEEFYHEHAPLTETGRMWFFSPRAGINLRQMWEDTNTIEFRHFAGTTNLIEIEGALNWCKDFLADALGEQLGPAHIYDHNKHIFPDFCEYNYKQEQIYQYTNHDKNTKQKVLKRVSYIRDQLNINEATLDDVYDLYMNIKNVL